MLNAYSTMLSVRCTMQTHNYKRMSDTKAIEKSGTNVHLFFQPAKFHDELVCIFVLF